MTPRALRQQTIDMRRVPVTPISECGTRLPWHRLWITRITDRHLCIVPGKFGESQFLADELDCGPGQRTTISYFTGWIIWQYIDTSKPGATTSKPLRVRRGRYRCARQGQRMVDPLGEAVVVVESAPAFVMEQQSVSDTARNNVSPSRRPTGAPTVIHLYVLKRLDFLCTASIVNKEPPIE